MATYDAVMLFDSSAEGKKDRYTKNGVHIASFGPGVHGGYIMSLGLLAAYNTVLHDFQVHHLVAQFFYPAVKEKALSFDVDRSSDRKHNATRVVTISQDEISIGIMTLDFARQVVSDTLSLSYQPRFPDHVQAPIEEVDELNAFYGGLVKGQSLGRVLDSDSVAVNSSTRAWLALSKMSPAVDQRMHHAGLACLSDLYIVDTPARLLNLQIGLGEPKVGQTQRDSPYNQRTTIEVMKGVNLGAPPPSDFTSMATINHTIHFQNPGLVYADDWIFAESSTSYAYGGRGLLHSKLFSRAGDLLAVCTQESYYRLKDGVVAERSRKSNL